MDTHFSWRRDFAWLFLGLALFFCLGLGARTYLTPSEARYIEIPRQMLATGDFLTPRINGVPYFEKPPLFYWVQAAMIGMFGTGEFAGRIATSLFSVGTCLITYATGRMLYGRRAGLLAAAALGTSILGYVLSRVATLDVPVTFFITACIACFLAAQRRKHFYFLMYVAAALAVMTKGLIGIAVPGLVIGAWIAATRRWHMLKEARLPAGLAIFLLIAAPWHVLMARAHPGFLDFYFIHEHVARYVSDEHSRTAPWWFFLAITAAGMLPWSGFFVIPAKAGIHLLRKMDPRAFASPKWLRPRRRVKPEDDNYMLFLLLWILLPLLFFSASHSKLVPYIFPVFPPLCMLLGRHLAGLWEARVPTRELRLNALFAPAMLLIAACAWPLLSFISPKAQAKLAGVEIPWVWLLPTAIAAALLIRAVAAGRSARTLIKLLALLGAVLGVSANYITAAVDHSGTKPLAALLKARLRDGDMVVAYKGYWQDLPVYLGRNVAVAGWRGELAFGVAQAPETERWMMPVEEFWRRCERSIGAVYVFISEKNLSGFHMPANCRLQPLASHGKTILLMKEAP